MKRSKILLAISFIFGSLVLTSCDTQNLGDNISETIKNNLFPNIWSFLAQILATIVLFVCIFFLAYKPTKKYLNKRRELLDNEVKETHKNKEESEINRIESEKNIAKSRAKAKQIVDDAKANAKLQQNEIVANAEETAKQIIKDSEDVVKRQQAKAMGEIKDAITDVAFTATTKILEREIDEKDNQKIIDDFVNELNGDNED